MTLPRARASTRRLGSTLLAAAVLAAFMAFASTGVAYADPSDECQASAGPPGVGDSGESTSDGTSSGNNAGNCGMAASPPILVSPLAPILCGTGAFCVP